MKNNKNTEPGREQSVLSPVFCFHITSLNPGQVESYPAVGLNTFQFFNPDRPVFYRA
jgi:hypothetical protein